MLTDFVRQWSRGIVLPITRFVSWSGVSPNAVTLAGFSLTVADAVLLALGYVQMAGILLLPAAALDAIDGSLARLQNRATPFGAFLDSTIDRFSEAAILMGALVYYVNQPNARTEILLLFVVLLGSLMVSYTKARGEACGVTVRGGLLTRMERMIVLIAALVLNELTVGLWVMAALTNITVLQRVWLVWRATRQKGNRQ
jgi:CDP-diacylglycerol--glycerol-3-phosphate 3-phosphatidyltransferase